MNKLDILLGGEHLNVPLPRNRGVLSVIDEGNGSLSLLDLDGPTKKSRKLDQRIVRWTKIPGTSVTGVGGSCVAVAQKHNVAILDLETLEIGRILRVPARKKKLRFPLVQKLQYIPALSLLVALFDPGGTNQFGMWVIDGRASLLAAHGQGEVEIPASSGDGATVTDVSISNHARPEWLIMRLRRSALDSLRAIGRVWDIPAQKRVADFDVPDASLSVSARPGLAGCLDDSGDILAMPSGSSFLLYDVRNSFRRVDARIPIAGSSGIESFFWSCDKKGLVIGTTSGSLQLSDVRTPTTPIRVWKAHRMRKERPVMHCCEIGAGRIASVGTDKLCKVWGYDGKKAQAEFRMGTEHPGGLCWIPSEDEFERQRASVRLRVPLLPSKLQDDEQEEEEEEEEGEVVRWMEDRPLHDFLKEIGMEKYYSRFVGKGIDYALLPSLREEKDLSEVVESLDDRKTIIAHIAAMFARTIDIGCSIGPPSIRIGRTLVGASLSALFYQSENTYPHGSDVEDDEVWVKIPKEPRRQKWAVDAAKVSVLDSEPLGVGTFGDVYRATLESDARVKTPVAVKMVPLQRVRREMIEKEVKLMCQVHHHRNILRCHGCFVDDRHCWIVLDLCDGGDLRQLLLKKKALSQAERVDMLIQIAEGVTMLHAQGIVHRDLKSSNILLAGGVPKITDFGIAARVSEIFDDHVLMGTPGYMPDPTLPWDWKRRDLYSFGMIAFEVLGSGEICYAKLREDGYEGRHLAKLIFSLKIFPDLEEMVHMDDPAVRSMVQSCWHEADFTFEEVLICLRAWRQRPHEGPGEPGSSSALALIPLESSSTFPTDVEEEEGEVARKRDTPSVVSSTVSADAHGRETVSGLASGGEEGVDVAAGGVKPPRLLAFLAEIGMQRHYSSLASKEVLFEEMMREVKEPNDLCDIVEDPRDREKIVKAILQADFSSKPKVASVKSDPDLLEFLARIGMQKYYPLLVQGGLVSAALRHVEHERDLSHIVVDRADRWKLFKSVRATFKLASKDEAPLKDDPKLLQFLSRIEMQRFYWSLLRAGVVYGDLRRLEEDDLREVVMSPSGRTKIIAFARFEFSRKDEEVEDLRSQLAAYNNLVRSVKKGGRKREETRIGVIPLPRGEMDHLRTPARRVVEQLFDERVFDGLNVDQRCPGVVREKLGYSLKFNREFASALKDRLQDPGLPKNKKESMLVFVMLQTMACLRAGCYPAGSDDKLIRQEVNRANAQASRQLSANYSVVLRPSFVRGTKTYFQCEDCVLIADQLRKTGSNPVIINLADPTRPNGGWKVGETSFEAQLTRRSNYCQYLSQRCLCEGWQVARHPPYSLSAGNGWYSKDVVFFRGPEFDGYPFHPRPTKVSVLAVCPGSNTPRDIEGIFRIAIAMGHDAVVLDAVTVAGGSFYTAIQSTSLYRSVLSSHFSGRLRCVVFGGTLPNVKEKDDDGFDDVYKVFRAHFGDVADHTGRTLVPGGLK